MKVYDGLWLGKSSINGEFSTSMTLLIYWRLILRSSEASTQAHGRWRQESFLLQPGVYAMICMHDSIKASSDTLWYTNIIMKSPCYSWENSLFLWPWSYAVPHPTDDPLRSNGFRSPSCQEFPVLVDAFLRPKDHRTIVSKRQVTDTYKKYIRSRSWTHESLYIFIYTYSMYIYRYIYI